MTAKENDSTCDSSAASQCPTAVYAKPFFPTGMLEGKDSPTPYDLDRVLAEAPEEMQFDLPELLMEIALGLFLFAALVAFCCFG
jgi:hypothetical protein